MFELVAVKLSNDKHTDKIIKNLNAKFKAENLPVKAVHWKVAGGTVVSFILGIKSMLYIFISFVFIVAIIIIMNTLAMSTLERSSELGMVRAIGAQRSFLARMLLTETFILSFLFGGAGILIGTFLIFIINAINLPVTNEMLQIITGGPVYKPIVALSDVITGFIFLGFVTLLSVIYPLRVSRKITPLDSLKKQ